MAQFEVFYDGECPLCMREIRMLQRLDRRGRILFTDIANPRFDEREVGVSWESLMERIHGRMPDGRVVEGVEVFRQLYSAVGLRWLMPITRIPGISHLLDLAYHAFAKNRLRFTGRCDENGCAVRRESAALPH